MFLKISQIYDRIIYLLGEDLGYFAASLSFYTVFSIIPVLWVTFFVLSKFQMFNVYFQNIKDFIILSIVPTHSESVSQYLDAFLQNTTHMGIWGLIYVVLASILFYKNYQYVVDKIFMTSVSNIWQEVETYLVLSLLMPLALGASFYLSGYVQKLLEGSGHASEVLSLLSFMMIWLLFFVLFKVSPNMKLNNRIVLFVSLLVSVGWQIAKQLFVDYVLVNQTYASLYGSFSVMLFVLLWVYLSWFLLLHGLRLCYLLQCRWGSK